MKITDFRQVKTFPHCSYRVDINWGYIEGQIKDGLEVGLDLNPDFQRAHVWNEKQQIDYCEYILRNGPSGKELYFNHPGWMGDWKGEYVIVDGKQRLEAVRCFMDGKIKVFRSYIHEYKNAPRMVDARFSWNVANLQTKKEVLEWYINFNSGGTVHTDKEIQKVKDMLKAEDDNG